LIWFFKVLFSPSLMLLTFSIVDLLSSSMTVREHPSLPAEKATFFYSKSLGFFFVFVVLNNFLIGRWDVFHLVFSKYEPHAQKIKKNETQNETKTKRGKRRRIKMWRNCSKSVKPAPWISSPVMQSAIQSKIISTFWKRNEISNYLNRNFVKKSRKK